MTTQEKLERANKLNKEIKNIKAFLDAIIRGQEFYRDDKDKKNRLINLELSAYIWTGNDNPRYDTSLCVDDVIEIVEEEAVWVRKIFEWYLDRVPLMEIRQRLIEANAPQKGSSRPRKVQWARSSIQSILKAAKEYSFGIKLQSRKGQIFEIPIEPILTPEIYEQFFSRQRKK